MKPLPSCSKQVCYALLHLSSETFQHFTSPGSPFEMLTFAVRVCHSRLLFEGLKWASTFLIVSSCSQCTLIWPVQPGIRSKLRESPYLLISREIQIQTQTHLHVHTRVHKSARTILIPVHELMRSSLSNHTLLMTRWSSTVLSLLTFKHISESSQEPPLS